MSSPQQIGQGGIPGNQCIQNEEPASNTQQDGVSTRELPDSQEKVAQKQQEENQHKRHIGPQRAKKQHSREDCPGEEEETKDGIIDSYPTDGAKDACAGDKDGTESDQEPSIRGEDGRSHRVGLPKLAHACEKLDKAPIEESSTDCDANTWGERRNNEACIVATKDDGGECKSTHTKRYRIGDRGCH